MTVFPHIRPRRLRQSPLMRDFTQDVRLELSDIIYPLFIKSGSDFKKPVSSMPGIFQISPDLAVQEIKRLSDRGVKQFMPFAIIEGHEKDACGSAALDAHNPVQHTLKMVKDQGIDAMMVADLCFCEYTDHGHCGALSIHKNETVDNDETLKMLGSQAVALARSGADIIAPSGMMDGMVQAIRHALDQENFKHIPIMSYSCKYASSFYGPFRDAAEGGFKFGDRKSYQMDFRRTREWQREMDLDIAEGADFLMVKPGIAYLDILTKIKERTSIPVGAYQVSGEYAMLHAASANGWLDLKSCALESLYAFKRAGADFIISYFGKDLPEWLEK